MTYNHNQHMREVREQQRLKCPRCGKRKEIRAFVRKNGQPAKRCGRCREKARRVTNPALHRIVQKLARDKRNLRPAVREKNRQAGRDYYASLTPEQKTKTIQRVTERRRERNERRKQAIPE